MQNWLGTIPVTPGHSNYRNRLLSQKPPQVRWQRVQLTRQEFERDVAFVESLNRLPNDLFYNTGIATYVWLLDSDKRADRKGKVQLIDATRMYAKMKKSLGNKRVMITDEQIAEIVKVYAEAQDGVSFTQEYKELPKASNVAPAEDEHPRVVAKRFDNTFFGYRKVTVDRPIAAGKEVKAKPKKGEKAYDPDLRDAENVPLAEDMGEYMKREVLPHVPDAWVNETIKDEKDGKPGKVGYVSITRWLSDACQKAPTMFMR